MEENHRPTIEEVLSAHGVGSTRQEYRKGPRPPAAVAAIIEDVLLIRPILCQPDRPTRRRSWLSPIPKVKG